MDFLFDRPAVIDCSLSLHDAADDKDDIILPEELLNALKRPGFDDEPRVAVSITRKATSNGSSLKSLVAWAVFDVNATAAAIPRSWLEHHSSIFQQSDLLSGQPTHFIKTVRPVVVSEAVFSAMSHDSYDFAFTHKTSLESWLFGKNAILRQGSIYSFDDQDLDEHSTNEGGCNIYRYQLAMMSPALQGYLKRGSSRIYISYSPHLEETHAAASSYSRDLDMQSDASSSELEFEITEGFLAGSILQPAPSGILSSHSYTSDVADTELITENIPDEKSHICLPEWHSIAIPLDRFISQQDDCTIYLHVSDLSHVGVLEGDWAVLKSSSGSAQRLVRVCVQDLAICNPGRVSLSPQLLLNTFGGNSISETPSILLRPSPFGSHRPAIPTARSVTIARVASPFSTNRAYQPLFLHALQEYFKKSTRLVKQGDVIGVKINTDDIHRSASFEEEEEDSGVEEGPDDLDHEYPDYSDTANELVYFLVTNIEHNVLTSQCGEGSLQDIYVGATVGELGCWIDSSVTRMIQTGLEHSRVPDISKGTPFLGYGGSSSLLTASDSPYQKLCDLASAALSRHAVGYQLQLSILLQGAPGVGKYTVASSISRRLGMHLCEIDCYDVVDDSDAKTEGTLRARFETAASCSPSILLLRHIDAFSQTTQTLEPGKEPSITSALQECIDSLQETWNLSGFPVIVVATTNRPERVPPRILACFKHEITLEVPGEAERHEILVSLLQDCDLAPDVSIRDLAVGTAALVASDLVDLVCRSKAASLQRAMQDQTRSVADLFNAGISMAMADFEAALSETRASYSESIGAPKIPSVSWDDVGGLAHVKADILDTIQLPLEHPELFADGLKKRSGILLYGPPGTGKTLLAKAVATSCALNFFSVKGPELLNMYIGESEANVRKVFQRARDARPCVIFFDELDSVAPKRGNHGDSGGVMDRIVSQLLAELDGLSGGKSGADVFVIGATNRPDLLDSALLRPGRFDRMLYLGVSKTHAAQLNILQALTRKFKLHPDLRLDLIAERCPFHYTGADFYALCADALLKAMSRKAEELEATIAWLNKMQPGPQHPYPLTPQYYLAVMATPAETQVLVSQEDFQAALDELVPSVSQAEMEHYARVQERFSGQTINGL
ncbi:uncharacterized protein FIBRA_08338 [Fibroporia radiculosa]|uniref:Peroxisomal ATPase PEX6 n=1 Tax=Fibroporia radiculosa TaxID=599839 RepID=J4ICA9_9APHY|nr:uncharacterized protein FIBRA_08338 [Fibroporia radiculosa]CCM06091.1 predicted protein [Fibroporia radiculosa]